MGWDDETYSKVFSVAILAASHKACQPFCRWKAPSASTQLRSWGFGLQPTPAIAPGKVSDLSWLVSLAQPGADTTINWPRKYGKCQVLARCPWASGECPAGLPIRPVEVCFTSSLPPTPPQGSFPLDHFSECSKLKDPRRAGPGVEEDYAKKGFGYIDDRTSTCSA